MNENELSYKVIGVALALHKNLGPGLLESVYENALLYDLRNSGFEVKQQHAVPFFYKQIKMEIGYRIDLLVEDKLIIEIKALENIVRFIMHNCLPI